MHEVCEPACCCPVWCNFLVTIIHKSIYVLSQQKCPCHRLSSCGREQFWCTHHCFSRAVTCQWPTFPEYEHTYKALPSVEVELNRSLLFLPSDALGVLGGA